MSDTATTLDATSSHADVGTNTKPQCVADNMDEKATNDMLESEGPPGTGQESASSTSRTNNILHPVYRDATTILAPMVRASTLPLRLLSRDLGCDLVYTEETIDKRIIQAQRFRNPHYPGTIEYYVGAPTASSPGEEKAIPAAPTGSGIPPSATSCPTTTSASTAGSSSGRNVNGAILPKVPPSPEEVPPSATSSPVEEKATSSPPTPAATPEEASSVAPLGASTNGPKANHEGQVASARSTASGVFLGSRNPNCNNGGERKSVFRTTDSEVRQNRTIFQLGTCCPDRALAAARVVIEDVAGVDVNMGCPKSFSVKGGMGAALLSQPPLAARIVQNLRANLPREKSVTCKIRFVRETDVNTVEVKKTTTSCSSAATVDSDPDRDAAAVLRTRDLVIKLLEAGADAVCVHMRYIPDRPRQPARWPLFLELRQALAARGEITNFQGRRIDLASAPPLIANGDFFNLEQVRCFRKLHPQIPLMIARGAQWNLALFTQVRQMMRNEAEKDEIRNIAALAQAHTVPSREECLRLYVQTCIDTGTIFPEIKWNVQEMILKDTAKLFGFTIKTLAQKVSSTKNISDLLTVLRGLREETSRGIRSNVVPAPGGNANATTTSKSAEPRSTTSTKVVEQQAVAPRSYPDDLASVEAEFEALLAPENQHKTTAVEEESVRVKQEDKQLQPRLEKTSSTDEEQGPFYSFVDGRSLRGAKGFRYVKSEHPEKAHTLAYMKEVLFGAIRDEAAQQQSAYTDRDNNLTEGADQLPPQHQAKRRRIDG